MLKYALFTAIFTFVVCLLLILLSKRISLFITDHLHNGPQRFHQHPTPRIGGIGLLIALFLSIPLAKLNGETIYKFFFTLFFVSLPAFLSGLLEDITHKLSPRIRLIGIGISAVFAFWFIDGRVMKVDIAFVDYILSFILFSFLFTVFAIVGLTNAINIIDGFNGLASMISIMILMSIAFVAYKVGDLLITMYCVIFSSAILGFFFLNYPFGFIFLGDGGAYFIGYFISLMSILLTKRNPQVSPWFAVMVNLYPIVETLFSIYRRKFIHNTSFTNPDNLHFHTLVHKIVVKKLLGIKNHLCSNFITSPFLWIFNLFAVVPAMLFWNSTEKLQLCVIFFTFLYISLFFVFLYPQEKNDNKINPKSYLS